MASGPLSYLLYEEPSVTTVLIQSSFLLLLNILNHLLDRLIYCGLLGQIFLRSRLRHPRYEMIAEGGSKCFCAARVSWSHPARLRGSVPFRAFSVAEQTPLY